MLFNMIGNPPSIPRVLVATMLDASEQRYTPNSTVIYKYNSIIAPLYNLYSCNQCNFCRLDKWYDCPTMMIRICMSHLSTPLFLNFFIMSFYCLLNYLFTYFFDSMFWLYLQNSDVQSRFSNSGRIRNSFYRMFFQKRWKCRWSFFSTSFWGREGESGRARG